MHNIFVYFYLFILNFISFIFYNYILFNILCTFNISLYFYFNIFEVIGIDYYDYFYFLFFDLYYFCFNIFSLFIFYQHNQVNFVDIISSSTYLFLQKFDFQAFSFDSLHVYCVFFDAKIIGSNLLEFFPLQEKLFILPGETTLSFYRLLNNTKELFRGFSFYIVSPSDLVFYLNKVQCFCFEQLTISSLESMDLPVLFFLDENVSYVFLERLYEFCIEYLFIVSAV